MKINELMDCIRNQDIVLPEFQREFVWSKEKAKQLIVSLVKKYPVGGLLLWKTNEPPELKNVKKQADKLGTTQVMLDGQQRLTTLYLLATGDVPPYYTEKDIQNDPRDLYYHLESGELQYYQSSRMKDEPLWCSVVDCLKGRGINIFEIAKKKNANETEAFHLAETLNSHLNDLVNIRELDLPVQTVPYYATLKDSIDIFDRVNSLGTKLTDAELALTHVTGKWPDARRLMKAKIEELRGRHFYFDLTFMTRALTGVVTRRALFSAIHDFPREASEQGWKKLTGILDFMVNLLPGQAFIHSTEDLNTTNILIPPIVHLSEHGGKFHGDKALRHALHWLYAAQTWARYTAQTDQRLEHDLSLVVREESPWDSLCNQIIDQRGRIEVKANDLEGRGVQHPLYRMTLTLAKAHGAVDWFNGVPLAATHGKPYQIHSHHIFPQSLLYRSGYDSDNHLHRQIINQIANRAFLTARSNLRLSDKAPEDYFPGVEKLYPGALTKQFIPMEPSLWKIERFEDFLDARRDIIARKYNEFMDAMVKEPELARKRPIDELVTLGESATLEFKSTLQWDLVQNQVNKVLRHSVLKTITAFLNSDGGTLVVGVEDDGNVLGLDNDLKTLKGSTDRFGQLLTSLVSEHIGVQYASFVKMRFDVVGNKAVCVVDVDKAPEPAYLKGLQGSEFHVRLGNTTRMLDPQETVDFIQMNWA